jgi:hypothetical protein
MEIPVWKEKGTNIIHLGQLYYIKNSIQNARVFQIYVSCFQYFNSFILQKLAKLAKKNYITKLKKTLDISIV